MANTQYKQIPKDTPIRLLRDIMTAAGTIKKMDVINTEILQSLDGSRYVLLANTIVFEYSETGSAQWHEVNKDTLEEDNIYKAFFDRTAVDVFNAIAKLQFEASKKNILIKFENII